MKMVSSTIMAIALMIGMAGSALADGAEMFGKKCAGCHGKDGKAATSMGKKLNMKDLTDPKVQAASTDAQWEKVILEGVKGDDGKSKMPASKISADDAKALVKFVRTLKK
jgi:mono/diheme cytochrome c family protein